MHCCNCLNSCNWRFASLVFLLLPALGFLVSPLATVPTLASKVRIVCSRISIRFTVVCLAFAFVLVVPFLALLTLSLRAFHLPEVHRCRRVRGTCRPRSSQDLCANVHSRTYACNRLTIRQGNHFQEVTVSCWCVFHHGRHLNRLLEVCTRGNSVLCNVFLLRNKHVTKGRVKIPLRSAAVRFPPLLQTLP